MKKTRDPLVSDQATGLYFWAHSDAERTYQFSNRPHADLPYHCAKHDWYSDVPCRACADNPKRGEPKRDLRQLELPW